jgi:hypothetical protein
MRQPVMLCRQFRPSSPFPCLGTGISMSNQISKWPCETSRTSPTIGTLPTSQRRVSRPSRLKTPTEPTRWNRSREPNQSSRWTRRNPEIRSTIRSPPTTGTIGRYLDSMPFHILPCANDGRQGLRAPSARSLGIPAGVAERGRPTPCQLGSRGRGPYSPAKNRAWASRSLDMSQRSFTRPSSSKAKRCTAAISRVAPSGRLAVSRSTTTPCWSSA